MSADVSAGEEGTDLRPSSTLPVYGKGAVDRFDIAAELEASGFNERLTRLHLDGRSLFEVAQTLHERRPESDLTRTVRSSVTRDDLIDATTRAFVLAAGVVLAATVFGFLGLGAAEIATASFAAWVGGQSTSAIMWARRGAGDPIGGLRAGGVWGLGGLAATTLVAVLTVGLWSTTSAVAALGSFVGMQLYSQAVAIVMVTPWVRRVGVGVVAGALAVFAAAAVDAPAPVVLAGAVAVVVGPAVVVGIAWAGASSSGGFQRRDLVPIPSAVLQALVLAGGILLLLGGPAVVEPTPFVAGSVTAIAVTDPVLVAGRRQLQRIARTRESRRAVTREARVLAVTSCLVPAVFAVGVAQAVGGWALPWTANDLRTALATAGYVAIATFSSSLRTYGAAWFAVVAALPALAGAVAMASGSAVWDAAVLFIGIVVGTWMLAVKVGDPRSYL